LFGQTRARTIDPLTLAIYSLRGIQTGEMVEQPIEKLERRVAELIKLAESMNRDNEILRNDQRMLRQEFRALQEKNKIARGRVEQIVARLKSLES
jgi:uncharacterized protein (TIGR02449 family)